jgi:triosephosphate isomerase
MAKDRKLIIFNWKDYIQTEAQARDILDSANDILESLSDTRELSLVFCPNEELLSGVGELLRESHLAHDSSLGSQDLVEQEVDGLRYVILGHSSRRYGLPDGGGETSEDVNDKIIKTLGAGLIPVVCIGEKEKDINAEEFIRAQVSATFNDLSCDQIGRCIVVYEPVWAITSEDGSSPDNPDDASKKIDLIKKCLNCDQLNIIYGGSVNSRNIVDFLNKDVVGGVLIGKAGTVKSEVREILLTIIKSQKNEND